MSNTEQSGASTVARVASWAGCLLGTGLLLLFALFVIGEGPPPMNVGAAALAVMLLGFLLAWWHDLLGAIVSILGIGCFYAWNFSEVGQFPGGFVFPLCFVPGALNITAWLLRKFA